MGPGPYGPDLSPDEYLARLGELPLSGQPGATWNYHTCSDGLSVLLPRVTGTSVGDLLTERVTGPLGLASAGFAVADPSALPTLYRPAPDGFEVADPPAGVYGSPRPFERLAAGLLTSVPDVLALFAALADGGGPVLSAASVAAMTWDTLSSVERAAAAPFLGRDRTWSLQVGVDLAGPSRGAGDGTGARARPRGSTPGTTWWGCCSPSDP